MNYLTCAEDVVLTLECQWSLRNEDFLYRSYSAPNLDVRRTTMFSEHEFEILGQYEQSIGRGKGCPRDFYIVKLFY